MRTAPTTDTAYWRKRSARLVRRRSSTLLSHVRLGEQVCELLQRAGLELGLLPELGSQEAVGVLKSSKGGLDEVTEGAGVAAGRSVAVLNASHLENLLRRARRDDTCTAATRVKRHVRTYGPGAAGISSDPPAQLACRAAKRAAL